MSPIIKLLYNTTVFSEREELRKNPDYQFAMEQWQEDDGDEDSVTLREHIWGQLSFAAGMRFGLSLALALFPQTED